MLVCVTDWYRGLERHLRHGSEDFFCLCCPVPVDVLRRANPASSKVLQNAYKKDSVEGRPGSPTIIKPYIRIHKYNNIRQTVRFVMPLTMQFSSACRYFSLPRSKCSPQNGKLQLSYLNNVRDTETACLIEATVFGRGLRGLANDVNYT